MAKYVHIHSYFSYLDDFKKQPESANFYNIVSTDSVEKDQRIIFLR